MVEIITSKRGGPSRDWMNPSLGFTKTNRARSKIRQWFRKQSREENIQQGMETLNRELKRLNIERSHDSIAKLFGYDKVDDFYAALGFGDINTQQVASKVLDMDRKEQGRGSRPGRWRLSRGHPRVVGRRDGAGRG